MTVRVLNGDCREVLATLPDESVHCVVTSPPYFGLRDYGHAGQIGLEPTPDEFVAALVAVFREVRRVLRDDGTVWLNLGDSYAGSGKGGNPDSGKQATNKGSQSVGVLYGKTGETARQAAVTNVTRDVDGIAPKNLIGIPWRVAFALQQPYYAGRIKSEIDRAWLAAMVDGEGCFYIHRRPAGQHAGGGYFRTQDSYSPAFEVANTHKAIIDRCVAITGAGSVICQEKDRRQPLWRWTVRATEARELARELYPYLVGKQQQCRILFGMPPSGEKAEAAWQAMKLLHAGRATTVDFPAPPSCLEPGWYLRQDVIWSKPNPMPESVRDRCTKAHEYIFLLAKSERYYYDADAIAEASVRGDAGSLFDAGKTSDAQLTPFSKGERIDDGRRNKRSVWTVSTKPFSGAHFATFPPDLIEPCVLAGCPAGGTVLDPFGGAGTTGLVADRHGRNAILIELNPEYAEMARNRIKGDAPLFSEVA